LEYKSTATLHSKMNREQRHKGKVKRRRKGIANLYSRDRWI